MNRVIETGWIQKEPVVRYTSGAEPFAVANYTLSVKRDYKNADGKYGYDYFRCVCYGKRAEWVESYLHEGMKILIEGSLKSGKYEKDGQTHFTTDIVVQRHEFCGSKNEETQTPIETEEVPDGFQALNEDVPF